MTTRAKFLTVVAVGHQYRTEELGAVIGEAKEIVRQVARRTDAFRQECILRRLVIREQRQLTTTSSR